jgi:AhpD family alkylhydroperoxidase
MDPATHPNAQGTMMAILPKIQEHDASPAVQETYKKVKARYGGFLPDIYKAFANDPEYLDSLNDHMARVLKPRKVDSKTKEVIALVVAAINNCDFCLNAHAGTLRRKFGYDDEGIAEILGTVALWSEVTQFNIAAGVAWPETDRRPKDAVADAA